MNKTILLCSQNAIFIKGIYGHLRDAGYCVETCEHPADAVKSAISAVYTAIIMDQGDIGLNAEDAAAIIRSIRPDVSIIMIGSREEAGGLYVIEGPDTIDRIKNILKDSIASEDKSKNMGGFYDAERNYIKSL